MFYKLPLDWSFPHTERSKLFATNKKWTEWKIRQFFVSKTPFTNQSRLFSKNLSFYLGRHLFIDK